MAQNAVQRRDTARVLARKLFVEANQLANFDLDDLTAAIGSIDDTMDVLPAALTAGQTVRNNIAARLPEPFKSTATAQQKGLAVAYWALKEVGLI